MWKLSKIFVVLLLLVSCSDDDPFQIKTTNDLDEYLNQTNYYQESTLDESETFIFSNGGFTKKYKNKRSGQERSFSGTYTIHMGKYSDNGKKFMYVRMVGNPSYKSEFGYFDLKHLVLCEGGDLCPPYENGFSINYEDEYGLKIKEYNVSLWCGVDTRSYYPVKK